MRKFPARVPNSSTQVLPASPSSAEERQPPPQPAPAHFTAAGQASRRSEPQAADWQAVLFKNNKPLGKLVSPATEFDPLQVSPEGQQEAEGSQAVVGRVALHFDRIVPVSTVADRSSGVQGEPEPLRLPLDSDFAQHSYRVQVIGRKGRANFAVPHAFRAEGRDLTAALSVQQQWQQYQQRHQAARASAGQPTSAANFAHSSTLAVEVGDGLERLQALFDVATRPAWLKGLVCRFLVTAESETSSVHGTSDIAAAVEQEEAAGTAIADKDMAAPRRTDGREASSWPAQKQRQLREPPTRQHKEAIAVEGSAVQPPTAPACPSAVPPESASAPVEPAAGAAPTGSAPSVAASRSGRSKGRKKALQQCQGGAEAADVAAPQSASPAGSSYSSSSSASSGAASTQRSKPAAAATVQRSERPQVGNAAQPEGHIGGKQQQRSVNERSRSASRTRQAQAGQHVDASLQQGAQPSLGAAAQQLSGLDAPLGALVRGLECEGAGGVGEAETAGYDAPCGVARSIAACSTPCSSQEEHPRWPAKPAASIRAKETVAAVPSAAMSSKPAPSGDSGHVAASFHQRNGRESAEVNSSSLVQVEAAPDVLTAAEPGCSTSVNDWGPPGQAEAAETVAALCAPVVWHGAADSAEYGALTTPPPAIQYGSRPASPVEGSVCSDGSTGSAGSSQDSWRSGVPENPSQYGLPYNFGQSSGGFPVFSWAQDHPAGVPLPAMQSMPACPQLQPPDMGRLHRRTRSGSMSMVPIRTVPLASNCGGAASFGAPLQRQVPSVAFARTGSSSSSGSDGTILPPGLHQPGLPLQWQGSGMGGWVDRIPGQPLMHAQSQVGVQAPPPFMPRSRSSGRGQWGRYRHRQFPDDDACLQPPHRSRNSWVEGRPQQQFLAEGVSLAPPPYAPPPPPPRSPHGSSLGPAVPAGANGSSLSAPASSASSPVLPGNGRPVPPPPASAPPPPPLALPALDLQVPESAADGPDLERFLHAAMPQVAQPSTGLQNLRLADLWRWYEGPSTVGCEVPINGGPRGPATAHYLPYLSAIQLFVPANEDDTASAGPTPVPLADQPSAAGAACTGGRERGAMSPLPLLSYPDGLDSWPECMRPLVQWDEAANMRDRVPLHCRLLELCGRAGELHPLMATRVADLHPLSWYAVAWYPLCSIPEAPLTARFLTFHTLASLWEAANSKPDGAAAATAAAEEQEAQQQAKAMAAAQAQQGQAGQDSPVAQPASQEVAAPAVGTPAPRPPPSVPARPSYKSMLTAGLPVVADVRHAASGCTGGAGTGAGTPTAICSFPNSPTCSDTGTRTTLGASRCHSVDGGSTNGSMGGSLDPRLERSRLACSSTASSAPSGCACATRTCDSVPGCEWHPCASPLTSSTVRSPSSSAISDMGDGGGEVLPVPVAGLVWYATDRGENWTETLVAAQLPPDVCAVPGTPLATGGHVVGVWRGTAVVSHPYPVVKGGPLGWEIQQEEMAQCAERLVSGSGLLALRPVGAGGATSVTPDVTWEPVGCLPPAALGISCRDYDFFRSRTMRYF